MFLGNIDAPNLSTKEDLGSTKVNKQEFKLKGRSFRKALEDIKEKSSEVKSGNNETKVKGFKDDKKITYEFNAPKTEGIEALEDGAELETPDKFKEDFLELLDLIFVASGIFIDKAKIIDSLKKSDIKELQKVFLELNSKTAMKFDTGSSETLLLKAENANESSNLMESLKNISDKFINEALKNEDFKALILDKLSEEPQKLISYEPEDLKEALISKINTLKEEVKSLGTEKNDITVDIKSPSDPSELKDSKEVINAVNSESVNEGSEKFSNNSETKFNVLKEDSGEDLLKNLLGDKVKEDKENTFAMRISNAVTRMETFKGEVASDIQQKPVIARDNFNVDFIKTVKYMDVNNVKELSVKVIPKELGEIVIRLTMDNGVMKANITAHNKETFELLNSNLPIINNELAKQNVTIQNFSLSLYNGENFLFNGNGSFEGNGANSQKRGTRAELMEQEEVTSENSSFEDNTVNILA